MPRQKLLLATSNEDKFLEMKKFLGDLPFEILSLKDLPKKIPEPEELETSIEENAILKAKYYGTKAKLVTISEDTGLFIQALNNWPGVFSARIGKDKCERRKIVLEKMTNIKNRKAVFQTAMAVYDPFDKSTHIFNGETEGEITLNEVNPTKKSFGYDPIFFVNEKGKTYEEMDINEKNGCSHRGKALLKTKYFLQNTFSPKQIVCPCGVLVKNGKFLITKRNDPHRPDYHEKWEFPGGGVEWGESIEENLRREVWEEAGYQIEIVKQLQQIYVAEQKYPNFSYQVFLIPIVCRVKKERGKGNDAEVLASAWIEPSLKEINKYNFVGENLNLIKKILPELKQTIKEFNL